MVKLRQFLSALPAGLLSLITVFAILWLTLAPKPLGENPPELFPGADKVVHAIMFGFLVAMMLLDWQRKHFWRKVEWGMASLYATAVSFFGIFTECAQNLLDYGRSFDWWDIVADTIGAFIVAVVWVSVQKFWHPIGSK